MAKLATRRNFLRTAPLAAAALPLVDAASLFAQTTPVAAPEKFQLFTAAALAESAKKLQAKPGNDNLFTPTSIPLTVVQTTEEKHTAKEYEWHEFRDHIVQIVAGETLYEVGGTPEKAHNTKPGEWLAPEATGATKYTLRKGDMLIIPRNTLHKRTTETSVTLILISSPGVVKS